MSARSVVVVLLALCTGGFAAFGIQQLQGTPVVEAGSLKLTPVVVVRQAVQRGTTVTAAMLELKDWPQEYVPKGVVTSLDKAEGYVCLQALLPGEPLLAARVAGEGTNRSAGNLVRPGMRAFSIIASTLATSVAGLVLPGDRVDVVLTVQDNVLSGPSGGGTATTLLQNIEVLALDQELEASDQNRSDPALKSVTLLVTQREASLLSLGQKTGVLSLSLRNPEDMEEADTQPVTLAEVRFRQEPVAPKPGLTGPSMLSVIHSVWDRVDASLKKAAAAKAPEPVVATSAEPVPVPKPRVGTIRTLRGSQPGVVLVKYGE